MIHASRVYFMRAIGGFGPVKIGCSSTPELRLRVYMQWAPYLLEIAAEIEGTHILEGRFHAKFAHLHSHHEWFKPAPELEATIEHIRHGTFDIASLPEGRCWIRSARARKAWQTRHSATQPEAAAA